MRRNLMILIVATSLLAAPTWAQYQPTGAEFLVNTYTTGNQRAPRISGGGDQFVIVWESGSETVPASQDQSFVGIFGQRMSFDGGMIGGEFQINTWTSSSQDDPEVDVGNGGDFLAVWSSLGQDTGFDRGIYGQLYWPNGNPKGPEFRANSTIALEQTDPDAAVAPNGDFLVCWVSQQHDGSESGVFAQHYASSGSPLGGEFLVNEYTSGNQVDPAVAALDTGGYVVTWSSFGQDGHGDGVIGRLFDPNAAPVGNEFIVNTSTTSTQRKAQVAAGPNGFIVTWEAQQFVPGDAWDIVGQRFTDDGTRIGGEFRANLYSIGNQTSSDVTIADDGSFVVAWNGRGFVSGTKAWGRSFNSDAFPTSPSDFLLGTTGAGTHSNPAIGTSQSGFLAAFDTTTGTADGVGVLGQGYFGSPELFSDGFESGSFSAWSSSSP